MTKKFEGTVFGKAVQEQNLEDIRTYLISAIDADPWFQSGEFEEKMAFLAQQGVDPTVPYVEDAVEFRKERGEWDKQYFFHLTEWLRLNFAPDQRLAHIREVGKAVFPAPAPVQAPATANHSKGAEHGFGKTSAALPPWASIALAAVAIGAAALLLHGVLFD